MPRSSRPAKATPAVPAQRPVLLRFSRRAAFTDALAAVVVMDTVPPLPVVAPDANVTVGLLMVHPGASVAPVGDVAKVQELRVMLIGPVYPPKLVAVIADVPLDPGATVTAAPTRA
jgi:hypothetical protein